MRPLSTLRMDDRDIAQLEAAAARPQSIAESVAAFRALYVAFAADLRATDDLFAGDRERHLRELQARLRQLGPIDAVGQR